MGARRVFRLFYRLITDREIHLLTGLAIRNLFRRSHNEPRSVAPAKKRAKAVNAK
jgi:hypothetical protein